MFSFANMKLSWCPRIIHSKNVQVWWIQGSWWKCYLIDEIISWTYLCHSLCGIRETVEEKQDLTHIAFTSSRKKANKQEGLCWMCWTFGYLSLKWACLLTTHGVWACYKIQIGYLLLQVPWKLRQTGRSLPEWTANAPTYLSSVGLFSQGTGPVAAQEPWDPASPSIIEQASWTLP